MCAKNRSNLMIYVCVIATWPDDTEAPRIQICNLNYKDLYCIPIVFHNLSDYDTHFIIKDTI